MNIVVTTKKKEKILEVIYILSIVCGIIGFVFVAMGASAMDNYTIVLKQAVPNDIDIKLALNGFVFLIVALLSHMIFEVIEIEYDYELNKIPLYFSNMIDSKVGDFRFYNQIYKCLYEFYEGNWGIAKKEDVKLNDINLDNKNGDIIGVYHTSKGMIFIIADYDIDRVTVMFSYELRRKENGLQRNYEEKFS